MQGNAWYRAQLNLQDMKIGHYMHIPPKDVFFSQVFGSFLGIPVNYAVIRWVLDTKADYLTGKEIDPTHQWTGQELASGLTTAVQYVMIVSDLHRSREVKWASEANNHERDLIASSNNTFIIIYRSASLSGRLLRSLSTPCIDYSHEPSSISGTRPSSSAQWRTSGAISLPAC